MGARIRPAFNAAGRSSPRDRRRSAKLVSRRGRTNCCAYQKSITLEYLRAYSWTEIKSNKSEGESVREKKKGRRGRNGRECRGKHLRIMPRCETHDSPRIITSVRHESCNSGWKEMEAGRENSPGAGIIVGVKRARPKRDSRKCGYATKKGEKE